MNVLKRLFLRLFLIIIFLILFLAAFIQVVISYKQVEELRSWKSLHATIISSNIYSEQRSKGITYCPKIKVEYSLEEKVISSNLEIEVASCRPAKYLVTKTLEKYSIGRDIIVLVNPLNNLEVRDDNYSLGVIFYLMSFLSIILFYGVIYTIFAPYDKLDRRKTINEDI